MAFGGTVKLMGESEYRQALQRCTQSLQTMSTALKNQTSTFNSNDKSIKNTAAMQKELNDTIKKQEIELTKAKNTYSQYAVAVQAQTTRHNALNKEFKNAVSELDRIKKASGESSNEYKKQAEVVDKLGKELADSSTQLDENKRAMSNLKSEINASTKTINNAKKELNDLGNEAEDSGKKAEKGSEGFTVFKGVLANLVTQGINASINGMKKLGTAVINVGKQAIGSYAEYEQLVGGVETLFKDSAKTVQDYAAQAYKTAGVSANEYMQQATSFSASLLQGLGGDTKKAAEIANTAIVDMSDNANKMGTSIEMIQNAYQGFAKQNYTMLDNLKLGYGGTKSEMARLVKESGILGKAGEELTATNLDQKVSFDQIIQAIHKVQENMGITGTTSKEASSTIEGSVKSMKASWSNLLTAIADNNKDISKSVDEFVDSAITAAKNLVPRIKVSIDGIKKLISSIVTEVFPKLKREIPELRPLIETFEWFINHKELVANAVKIMIAAFAIKKLSPFTKMLSDMSKSLINLAKDFGKTATMAYANAAATTTNTAAQVGLTTAQTLGTVATKGLTAATKLLNAAWKANPIGLIITGITALVSIISIFKSKTDETTKAQEKQNKKLEEQKEKIEENTKAWEDLQKAQQNNMDKGLTELSYYESLYDELQGIVDQNGKVKEGYEQRASFITSTLANALGIEIKNVDGVIQNYNNLKNTIDEVMEKKKAQIILDSQESLYSEAITKQGEATKDLITYEDVLNGKKSERAKLEEELKKKQEEYKKAQDSWLTSTKLTAKYELEQVEEKIAAKDKEVSKAQSNYNKQKELLSEYAFNIGQYENNMALAHAGKYSEMTQVNWNYVKEYESTGDAQKKQLEDQIKTTETNLNLLKELKKQTGSDIYDQQIRDAEKQLEQHKESLKQYESATKTGLDANKIQWKNGLDNVLSEITGKNISFKEDGKGNVQMYVDGVKSGKKTSKEEMAKIISETISEVTKKDKDAKKAGEDLIDGVNNGVKNQDKQSSVFRNIASFGSSILSKLKSSLKEKSPSKATKEMGQFLLEGLGIGIEQEENSVLKQVSNVGKNVLTALQSELNQNVRLGDIQASVNSSTSSAENKYYSTVEAFKEALSEMKIEMDDTEMGKFVDKTVSRTIYS